MVNNMGLFDKPSTPNYTPQPAPPPLAAPATLASSSVATRQTPGVNQAYEGTLASGGGQGVDPASVRTGKTTLGGT